MDGAPLRRLGRYDDLDQGLVQQSAGAGHPSDGLIPSCRLEDVDDGPRPLVGLSAVQTPKRLSKANVANDVESRVGIWLCVWGCMSVHVGCQMSKWVYQASKRSQVHTPFTHIYRFLVPCLGPQRRNQLVDVHPKNVLLLKQGTVGERCR